MNPNFINIECFKIINLFYFSICNKKSFLFFALIIIFCYKTFPQSNKPACFSYPTEPVRYSNPVKSLQFSNETEPVRFSNPTELEVKRKDIINYIWGQPILPSDRTIDFIEHNIVFTGDSGIPDTVTDHKYDYCPNYSGALYESIYYPNGNLDSIDRYTINLGNSLQSKVYHFFPHNRNGKVFIYHSGHIYGRANNWDSFQTEDQYMNNLGLLSGEVIPRLIAEGYEVICFMMPLYGNNRPIINIPNIGDVEFDYHNQIFYYLPQPYTYFFNPIVRVLNYVQKVYGHSSFNMIGLSGGGWTTTLYAAIDPRIKNSFPIAGSVPLPYRPGYKGLGDYEQGIDEQGLYGIVNYTELYIMGAYGDGRSQVQMLNQFDNCCFWGTRYPLWVNNVKQSIKALGLGNYDFLLDTKSYHVHRISEYELDAILSYLKGNKIESNSILDSVYKDNALISYEPFVKRNEIQISDSLIYEPILMPKWLNYNSSTGVFLGTPTNQNLGDTVVSFKVDGPNSTFLMETYNISVKQSHKPEFVYWNPNTIALEDELYSQRIRAIDKDSALFGDVVKYKLINKPNWLSIDSVLGVIIGIPRLENIHDTIINVEANDHSEGGSTQQFKLHVIHVNHPPLFTSIPNIDAYEEEPYIYQCHANDKDSALFGDLVRYKFLRNPSWLSIDSLSGKIEGTPKGFFINDENIEVESHDGKGGVSYQNFYLKVNPTKYFVYQNFPNPFGSSTIIRYSIPEKSAVNITIYNINGQRMFQIVNLIKEIGYYESQFDASNLPEGMYICKIVVVSDSDHNKQFSKVLKMIKH